MGFDERLIYEVKRHELLYNLHHPDYRNLHVKAEAWRDIAVIMKCKPELCRKRWKSLRDTYKRSNKCYKYANSSQRLKLSRWKYYDKMHFLKPYLREKVSSTNTDDLNEDFLDGIFETVDMPDNTELRSRIIKKETFSAFEEQDTEDDCKDEMSDCYNCAKRHEASLQTATQDETKNSTMMFFELLGKKVVEAKLPVNMNLQLETDVFQLVYGTIVNYKKSSK